MGRAGARMEHIVRLARGTLTGRHSANCHMPWQRPRQPQWAQGAAPSLAPHPAVEETHLAPCWTFIRPDSHQMVPGFGSGAVWPCTEASSHNSLSRKPGSRVPCCWQMPGPLLRWQWPKGPDAKPSSTCLHKTLAKLGEKNETFQLRFYLNSGGKIRREENSPSREPRILRHLCSESERRTVLTSEIFAFFFFFLNFRTVIKSQRNKECQCILIIINLNLLLFEFERGVFFFMGKIY